MFVTPPASDRAPAMRTEPVLLDTPVAALIEAWRQEYNEERPKKGLGGLTPAAYGRQLAKETGTVTAGL